MSPTLNRIGEEAAKSGFFDKIWLYDDQTLDRTFYRERKDFFRNYTRGFGYWLWKPFLIKSTLENKMEEGDLLVYLDAGCEIHPEGSKRWEEYKQMLQTHSLLVYDHLHSFEHQFTKMDVLRFFHVEKDTGILESRQLWAGGMMIRKDAFAERLISQWFDICDTYRTSLLCDAPSADEELPTFKQHCHDQSLFSVLCKVTDRTAIGYASSGSVKVLPMTENYPFPHDWSRMTGFPFWAKRNKAFLPPSLWERVKRRIGRFVRCKSDSNIAQP